MRTFKTLGTAIAALTASMFAGYAIADNSTTCDIIKACENGCYSAFSRAVGLPPIEADSGGCPRPNPGPSDYIDFSFPLDEAPGPVLVECSVASGVGFCEGWPQGESVTYAWSTTGGISIDNGAAANAVRGFTCAPGTHGTVTMSAIGPQGAAKSSTIAVSCQ